MTEQIKQDDLEEPRTPQVIPTLRQDTVILVSLENKKEAEEKGEAVLDIIPIEEFNEGKILHEKKYDFSITIAGAQIIESEFSATLRPIPSTGLLQDDDTRDNVLIQTTLTCSSESQVVSKFREDDAQTVFTYTADRSDTSVIKELKKSFPKHESIKEDPHVDATREHTPLDDVPLEQVPPDAALEQAPANEAPPDGSPPDKAPPDDTPLNQESIDKAPLDKVSLNEAISKEKSLDEAPPKGAPIKDAPPELTTLEHTPLDDFPIEQAPPGTALEQAPANEAPSDGLPPDDAPLNQESIDKAPLDKVSLDEAPPKEKSLDESPPKGAPPKEAPPELTTLEHTPLDDVPLEQAPPGTALEQAPANEAPPDGSTPDKAPPDDAPLNQESIDKAPLDKVSLDEAPPKEKSLDESPPKEAPPELTTLEHTPLDDIPLEQAPPGAALEQAPANEAPPDGSTPDKAPPDDAPLNQESIDKALLDKVSLDEAPPKEKSLDESPPKEAPLEEAPPKGASSKVAPSEVEPTATLEEVPTTDSQPKESLLPTPPFAEKSPDADLSVQETERESKTKDDVAVAGTQEDEDKDEWHKTVQAVMEGKKPEMTTTKTPQTSICKTDITEPTISTAGGKCAQVKLEIAEGINDSKQITLDVWLADCSHECKTQHEKHVIEREIAGDIEIDEELPLDVEGLPKSQDVARETTEIPIIEIDTEIKTSEDEEITNIAVKSKSEKIEEKSEPTESLEIPTKDSKEQFAGNEIQDGGVKKIAKDSEILEKNKSEQLQKVIEQQEIEEKESESAKNIDGYNKIENTEENATENDVTGPDKLVETEKPVEKVTEGEKDIPEPSESKADEITGGKLEDEEQEEVTEDEKKTPEADEFTGEVLESEEPDEKMKEQEISPTETDEFTGEIQDEGIVKEMPKGENEILEIDQIGRDVETDDKSLGFAAVQPVQTPEEQDTQIDETINEDLTEGDKEISTFGKQVDRNRMVPCLGEIKLTFGEGCGQIEMKVKRTTQSVKDMYFDIKLPECSVICPYDKSLKVCQESHLAQVAGGKETDTYSKAPEQPDTTLMPEIEISGNIPVDTETETLPEEAAAPEQTDTVVNISDTENFPEETFEEASENPVESETEDSQEEKFEDTVDIPVESETKLPLELDMIEMPEYQVEESPTEVLESTENSPELEKEVITESQVEDLSEGIPETADHPEESEITPETEPEDAPEETLPELALLSETQMEDSSEVQPENPIEMEISGDSEVDSSHLKENVEKLEIAEPPVEKLPSDSMDNPPKSEPEDLSKASQGKIKLDDTEQQKVEMEGLISKDVSEPVTIEERLSSTGQEKMPEVKITEPKLIDGICSGPCAIPPSTKIPVLEGETGVALTVNEGGAKVQMTITSGCEESKEIHLNLWFPPCVDECKTNESTSKEPQPKFQEGGITDKMKEYKSDEGTIENDVKDQAMKEQDNIIAEDTLASKMGITEETNDGQGKGMGSKMEEDKIEPIVIEMDNTVDTEIEQEIIEDVKQGSKPTFISESAPEETENEGDGEQIDNEMPESQVEASPTDVLQSTENPPELETEVITQSQVEDLSEGISGTTERPEESEIISETESPTDDKEDRESNANANVIPFQEQEIAGEITSGREKEPSVHSSTQDFRTQLEDQICTGICAIGADVKISPSMIQRATQGISVIIGDGCGQAKLNLTKSDELSRVLHVGLEFLDCSEVCTQCKGFRTTKDEEIIALGGIASYPEINISGTEALKALPGVSQETPVEKKVQLTDLSSIVNIKTISSFKSNTMNEDIVMSWAGGDTTLVDITIMKASKSTTELKIETWTPALPKSQNKRIDSEASGSIAASGTTDADYITDFSDINETTFVTTFTDRKEADDASEEKSKDREIQTDIVLGALLTSDSISSMGNDNTIGNEKSSVSHDGVPAETTPENDTALAPNYQMPTNKTASEAFQPLLAENNNLTDPTTWDPQYLDTLLHSVPWKEDYVFYKDVETKVMWENNLIIDPSEVEVQLVDTLVPLKSLSSAAMDKAEFIIPTNMISTDETIDALDDNVILVPDWPTLDENATANDYYYLPMGPAISQLSTLTGVLAKRSPALINIPIDAQTWGFPAASTQRYGITEDDYYSAPSEIVPFDMLPRVSSYLATDDGDDAVSTVFNPNVSKPSAAQKARMKNISFPHDTPPLDSPVIFIITMDKDSAENRIRVISEKSMEEVNNFKFQYKDAQKTNNTGIKCCAHSMQFYASQLKHSGNDGFDTELVLKSSNELDMKRVMGFLMDSSGVVFEETFPVFETGFRDKFQMPEDVPAFATTTSLNFHFEPKEKEILTSEKIIIESFKRGLKTTLLIYFKEKSDALGISNPKCTGEVTHFIINNNVQSTEESNAIGSNEPPVSIPIPLGRSGKGLVKLSPISSSPSLLASYPPPDIMENADRINEYDVVYQVVAGSEEKSEIKELLPESPPIIIRIPFTRPANKNIPPSTPQVVKLISGKAEADIGGAVKGGIGDQAEIPTEKQGTPASTDYSGKGDLSLEVWRCGNKEFETQLEAKAIDVSQMPVFDNECYAVSMSYFDTITCYNYYSLAGVGGGCKLEMPVEGGSNSIDFCNMRVTLGNIQAEAAGTEMTVTFTDISGEPKICPAHAWKKSIIEYNIVKDDEIVEQVFKETVTENSPLCINVPLDSEYAKAFIKDLSEGKVEAEVCCQIMINGMVQTEDKKTVSDLESPFTFDIPFDVDECNAQIIMQMRPLDDNYEPQLPETTNADRQVLDIEKPKVSEVTAEIEELKLPEVRAVYLPPVAMFVPFTSEEETEKPLSKSPSKLDEQNPNWIESLPQIGVEDAIGIPCATVVKDGEEFENENPTEVSLNEIQRQKELQSCTCECESCICKKTNISSALDSQPETLKADTEISENIEINTNTTQENIESPDENVESPEENVESPEENVESPEENVDSPKKNVASMEHIQIKSEELDTDMECICSSCTCDKEEITKEKWADDNQIQQFKDTSETRNGEIAKPEVLTTMKTEGNAKPNQNLDICHMPQDNCKCCKCINLYQNAYLANTEISENIEIDINMTQENVESPDENVESPEENVESPEKNIDSPKKNVASMENIQIKSEEMDTDMECICSSCTCDEEEIIEEKRADDNQIQQFLNITKEISETRNGETAKPEVLTTLKTEGNAKPNQNLDICHMPQDNCKCCKCINLYQNAYLGTQDISSFDNKVPDKSIESGEGRSIINHSASCNCFRCIDYAAVNTEVDIEEDIEDGAQVIPESCNCPYWCCKFLQSVPIRDKEVTEHNTEVTELVDVNETKVQEENVNLEKEAEVKPTEGMDIDATCICEVCVCDENSLEPEPEIIKQMETQVKEITAELPANHSDDCPCEMCTCQAENSTKETPATPVHTEDIPDIENIESPTKDTTSVPPIQEAQLTIRDNESPLKDVDSTPTHTKNCICLDCTCHPEEIINVQGAPTDDVQFSSKHAEKCICLKCTCHPEETNVQSDPIHVVVTDIQIPQDIGTVPTDPNECNCSECVCDADEIRNVQYVSPQDVKLLIKDNVSPYGDRESPVGNTESPSTQIDDCVCLECTCHPDEITDVHGTPTEDLKLTVEDIESPIRDTEPVTKHTNDCICIECICHAAEITDVQDTPPTPDAKLATGIDNTGSPLQDTESAPTNANDCICLECTCHPDKATNVKGTPSQDLLMSNKDTIPYSTENTLQDSLGQETICICSECKCDSDEITDTIPEQVTGRGKMAEVEDTVDLPSAERRLCANVEYTYPTNEGEISESKIIALGGSPMKIEIPIGMNEYHATLIISTELRVQGLTSQAIPTKRIFNEEAQAGLTVQYCTEFHTGTPDEFKRLLENDIYKYDKNALSRESHLKSMFNTWESIQILFKKQLGPVNKQMEMLLSSYRRLDMYEISHEGGVCFTRIRNYDPYQECGPNTSQFSALQQSLDYDDKIFNIYPNEQFSNVLPVSNVAKLRASRFVDASNVNNLSLLNDMRKNIGDQQSVELHETSYEQYLDMPIPEILNSERITNITNFSKLGNYKKGNKQDLIAGNIINASTGNLHKHSLQHDKITDSGQYTTRLSEVKQNVSLLSNDDSSNKLSNAGKDMSWKYSKKPNRVNQEKLILNNSNVLYNESLNGFKYHLTNKGPNTTTVQKRPQSYPLYSRNVSPIHLLRDDDNLISSSPAMAINFNESMDTQLHIKPSGTFAPSHYKNVYTDKLSKYLCEKAASAQSRTGMRRAVYNSQLNRFILGYNTSRGSSLESPNDYHIANKITAPTGKDNERTSLIQPQIHNGKEYKIGNQSRETSSQINDKKYSRIWTQNHITSRGPHNKNNFYKNKSSMQDSVNNYSEAFHQSNTIISRKIDKGRMNICSVKPSTIQMRPSRSVRDKCLPHLAQMHIALSQNMKSAAIFEPVKRYRPHTYPENGIYYQRGYNLSLQKQGIQFLGQQDAKNQSRIGAEKEVNYFFRKASKINGIKPEALWSTPEDEE